MEQIEIDLHGRDALEAVLSLLSGKDPDVVWCNELNVGSLLPGPHADAFSDVVRVTLDVDGVEPKAREVVEDPCRWEAGESVADIQRTKLLVEAAGKLDSAAAQMTGCLLYTSPSPRD